MKCVQLRRRSKLRLHAFSCGFSTCTDERNVSCTWYSCTLFPRCGQSCVDWGCCSSQTACRILCKRIVSRRCVLTCATSTCFSPQIFYHTDCNRMVSRRCAFACVSWAASCASLLCCIHCRRSAVRRCVSFYGSAVGCSTNTSHRNTCSWIVFRRCASHCGPGCLSCSRTFCHTLGKGMAFRQSDLANGNVARIFEQNTGRIYCRGTVFRRSEFVGAPSSGSRGRTFYRSPCKRTAFLSSAQSCGTSTWSWWRNTCCTGRRQKAWCRCARAGGAWACRCGRISYRTSGTGKASRLYEPSSGPEAYLPGKNICHIRCTWMVSRQCVCTDVVSTDCWTWNFGRRCSTGSTLSVSFEDAYPPSSLFCNSQPGFPSSPGRWSCRPQFQLSKNPCRIHLRNQKHATLLRLPSCNLPF